MFGSTGSYIGVPSRYTAESAVSTPAQRSDRACSECDVAFFPDGHIIGMTGEWKITKESAYAGQGLEIIAGRAGRSSVSLGG